MKRILITGAAGFTGKTLTRSMQGPDWEIIPMDRVETGSPNDVVIDFSDDRFSPVLHRLPPVDTVVHLGTHVGWDGANKAVLFQPNILATAELVQWAAENKSYFIFASAALIAGEKNTLITSSSPLGTSNDYLHSKWLAEEIIKASGVSYAILRIPGIFGLNGPSHLGINKAITHCLNGIRPTRYGDGKIKRNYIYVKDLCNTIHYCTRNRLEGTFLAAGTDVNTVAEMLEIICRELLPGKTPEVLPAGTGYDQVVEPSPLLPQTRTFEDAIKDIKKDIDE